jgi:hypothetical protein
MKFSGFILFIFTCTVFILSCIERPHPEDAGYGPKPDSVLSEQKMILLLADIHILEAGLNMEKDDGALVDDSAAGLYHGLFRKYNITRSHYDASLRYYNSNPQLFAKLYAKAVETIEKKKQKQPVPEP